MKTRSISAAALVLGILLTSSAAAADRPNVLFIAIDDLNDWVGCLQGHPQAITPNIDRLAARGTLFTNAHCQAPICGPSRASLLTGRYPHETGIYQQPTRAIADDEQTASQMMPRYFAQHGYATFAGGKICHGFRHQQAFDHYAGGMGGSGPKPPNKARFHYRPPDTPWTGTQTDWGPFPDADEEMPDHKVASWAVETLQQRHDKPFFLAVGFVRPHVPFYAPQRWFDPFPLESVKLPAVRADDMDDLPEIARAINELPNYPNLALLQRDGGEQFRRCVQAYLACVQFVDHQVGRVIDALDASRYADNTVIVLFSDHGYHLGEKDRVSKHTLWEESTRVPLIVARPGKTDSQLDQPTVARSVGLIDLFPTLIELTGLPERAANSGASLVRLMVDPAGDWRGATITTYARGNHSLRSDRYRYIAYPDGSEELYDHQSDPDEWNNLAGDAAQQAVLASFRRQLPERNASYHPQTSNAPINIWFKEHYRSEGLR